MYAIGSEKAVTLDKIDRQWLLAVDEMPQLICLVANDGRVIRVNRTLECWQLGDVDAVRGVYLHDALHKNCNDPACYLRLFVQRTLGKWGTERRTQCDFWDSVLERHIAMRITMPVGRGRLGGGLCCRRNYGRLE